MSEWITFPPINRALIVTDGTRAKLCYFIGGRDGFATVDGFPLEKGYHPTHWMLLPDPPK
jgi:hypothetical protein